MTKLEREAKRERIERLRDAALRLAKTDRSRGNIELCGERKRVMEWRHNELYVQLLEARPIAPSAFSETSRLRIVYCNKAVLNIRWDDERAVEVISFKPGDWEKELYACFARTLR